MERSIEIADKVVALRHARLVRRRFRGMLPYRLRLFARAARRRMGVGEYASDARGKTWWRENARSAGSI